MYKASIAPLVAMMELGSASKNVNTHIACVSGQISHHAYSNHFSKTQVRCVYPYSAFDEATSAHLLLRIIVIQDKVKN